MKYMKKHYPAILVLLVAAILWEFIIRITNTPIWILPAPSQIIRALLKERNLLLEHTMITLFEAFIGFILALIVAFVLAIIISNSNFFKRGFYPILVTSQTIPIIALAPLFIIWFGFGILPKVIVVALVAFFPIVVNFVDGLNTADKGLIDLLRTMNASKWQIFIKIKLPSSLPLLFSGLRIAATYSVMGAVIGEWMGSSKGLGYFMKITSHSFLTDQYFASIIVVVISSILFYSFLLFLESRIVSWNRKKI